MIHHLVWFKLKEGITAEEKALLKANMLEMGPQIPLIVNIACGEDFSGRSRGFEFGLSVLFETPEDLKIYDQHPAHQAFIAKSKHLWTDVQALDFQA